MLSHKELDKLRQDIQVQSNMRDVPLILHSTWGIFSPREIDEGTELLMKYIDVKETDDCLDLGCGYGSIGLTLASLANKGHTTLVDRDFIAVEYAKKNIQANKLSNAQALLSNGFSEISDRQFDIIASNIPAKVGNEMLSLFLHDGWHQLKPGGRFYVVTINGLRIYMKRNFMDIFSNYKKCKQGKNYTVAMAYKN
ncbi:MAG: methyltransferase [Gammaproteobacteria bacterium]|nr:methyltransferase [Gammaproteobacteria bacterium]